MGNNTTGLNKLTLTAIAYLGVGAAAASGATVYNFAYTFGDGQTASGSFTGTASGDLIENITPLSLTINGSAIPGPLYLNWNLNTPGPVISTDVTQNNFVFQTGPVPSPGDTPGPTDFLMATFFPNTPSAIVVANISVNYPIDFDFGVNPANWSVTPAAAPEPTTMVAGIASLGLAAMGLLRRARR